VDDGSIGPVRRWYGHVECYTR